MESSCPNHVFLVKHLVGKTGAGGGEETLMGRHGQAREDHNPAWVDGPYPSSRWRTNLGQERTYDRQRYSQSPTKDPTVRNLLFPEGTQNQPCSGYPVPGGRGFRDKAPRSPHLEYQEALKHPGRPSELNVLEPSPPAEDPDQEDLDTQGHPRRHTCKAGPGMQRPPCPKGTPCTRLSKAFPYSKDNTITT